MQMTQILVLVLCSAVLLKIPAYRQGCLLISSFDYKFDAASNQSRGHSILHSPAILSTKRHFSTNTYSTNAIHNRNR